MGKAVFDQVTIQLPLCPSVFKFLLEIVRSLCALCLIGFLFLGS
jgi:hypothetical protein